jgi:GTP diphosphokinase / guanosine-3',5'-bis(diphosphate) 3'-diphosphatase
MPAVRIAKCCHTIPGDSLEGLFRKSVGLEIHREGCEQPRKLLIDAVEYVPVAWAEPEALKGDFTARLKVVNVDEKGALAQLATVIAHCDCSIERLDIDLLHGGRGLLVFDVRVKNAAHCQQLLNALRGHSGVQSAERV